MPQEPQGRKAFLFPIQVAEILLKIPQDSCQRICQAALAYNLGRELPEMDVMESALFDSFRAQFDYFRERYQATCDRRREAANKRWKKQEICSAGAQDMHSTCSAGAQDMHSTCSAGAQDMHSTCSAGAQDMLSISIGYAEECIKDKDKDKDKDKEKNTPPNLGQPIAHTARAREGSLASGAAAGAFFPLSGGEEDAHSPSAQPEEEYALHFREFLAAYPADHRRGEAKAYALWHKLAYTPGIGHNRLMDSLLAWRDSEQWRREDGKYIPMVDKFLEREYWREMPKPSIFAATSRTDLDTLTATSRTEAIGQGEASAAGYLTTPTADELEAHRKELERARLEETIRHMPLVDLLGESGYRQYQDLFTAGDIEGARALADSARAALMAKKGPE